MAYECTIPWRPGLAIAWDGPTPVAYVPSEDARCEVTGLPLYGTDAQGNALPPPISTPGSIAPGAGIGAGNIGSSGTVHALPLPVTHEPPVPVAAEIATINTWITAHPMLTLGGVALGLWLLLGKH